MGGAVQCYSKVTLLGNRVERASPGSGAPVSGLSIACIWMVVGTGCKERNPLDSLNSLSIFAFQKDDPQGLPFPNGEEKWSWSWGSEAGPGVPPAREGCPALGQG